MSRYFFLHLWMMRDYVTKTQASEHRMPLRLRLWCFDNNYYYLFFFSSKIWFANLYGSHSCCRLLNTCLLFISIGRHITLEYNAENARHIHNSHTFDLIHTKRANKMYIKLCLFGFIKVIKLRRDQFKCEYRWLGKWLMSKAWSLHALTTSIWKFISCCVWFFFFELLPLLPC